VRKTRLFVYLCISAGLFFINLLILFDRIYPASTYLILLDVFVSCLIILDLLYDLSVHDEAHRLRQENDRLRLALADCELESRLLTAVTDLIEASCSGAELRETLDAVAESVSKLFSEETTVLQLTQEQYVIINKGPRRVDVTDDFFEDASPASSPILVNTVGTLPRYRSLAEQGVTSFIVCPLLLMAEPVGFISVFSFTGRTFTGRDMKLLHLVATPTALLLRNAELLEETRNASITDAVTQVRNRGYFERMLPVCVEEALKKQEELCLCLCDIDYFKSYNGSCGHPAGDAALRQTALLLRRGLKGSDIVARYGGDEFAIIMVNTSKENAVRVAENLRLAVRTHRFSHGRGGGEHLTISFGIAGVPRDARTAEELMKKADEALYGAKAGGRDRVVAAQDQNQNLFTQPSGPDPDAPKGLW